MPLFPVFLLHHVVGNQIDLCATNPLTEGRHAHNIVTAIRDEASDGHPVGTVDTLHRAWVDMTGAQLTINSSLASPSAGQT
jgi:hypothetical protein